MRRLILTPLAVLLLATSSGARDKALVPGTVMSRTTASGVPYAFYIPKGWRKGRTLPLVVHVPAPQTLPHEALAWQKYFESWGGAAGPVFHCAYLVESHNREDGHLSGSVNKARYLRLMEKDAAVLRTVLDELSKELPFQPEAVILQGIGYAAEVGLGIAVRNPDRVAATVLLTLHTATLSASGAAPRWDVLGARAEEPAGRDIRVFFPLSPHGGDHAENLRVVRLARDVLGHYAYKNVHILGVGPDDRILDGAIDQAQLRVLELAEARRARAKLEADRDEMLAAGLRDAERDRLSIAVRTYRRICAFEEENELDTKSLSLWEALELKGRAMLAEAGAQPPRKKKAAYRKIARLFADTPLAEEIKSLLDGLK